MRLQTALPAAALLVLGAVAQAGDIVGEPLPDGIELTDFAQTGATSVDDLFGRTVLIEYFAYW